MVCELGYAYIKCTAVEGLRAIEGTARCFLPWTETQFYACRKICETSATGWANLKIFVAVAAFFLAISASNHLSAQDPLNIQAAYSAHESGDYQNAIRLFRSLAEGGSPEAQMMLGRMYHSGLGVPANDPESVKWYIYARCRTGPYRGVCNALLGVLRRSRRA